MHGITKRDKGIVGFVEELGHHWHGFENYVEINGAVPFDEAQATLNVEVVKLPLALHISPEVAERYPELAKLNGVVPQTNFDKEGLSGPLMFALTRIDTGDVLYDLSVSGGYEVYQNKEFLDKVQISLLNDNPQVAIESVGTLFGGRICFVNIILDRFHIGKDESPQITRVMFYNAFGGRSITACMHHIRIVCNNTLMLAEAQGALNETLKKFRHTSGAPKKVADHLMELNKLKEISDKRKEIMENLSTVQMTTTDVSNFIGNLIEIPEGAGKGTVTGRTNRQEKIISLFETIPDLQGPIAYTRYAMLQAVTAYNQHHTIPEGSVEVDPAFAWWDVSTGGVRNDLNQKAFNILSLKDIPAPKQKKNSGDA